MTEFALLRPLALAAVRRRVDQEVQASTGDALRHARLLDARADLLRPLDLLAAAGELALPALADDHAASRRLRLLLAATATVFEVDGAGGADVAAAITRFASLARTSGDVLMAASNATSDGADGEACEAGIVDHGALVIVACACLHAGADDGLGPALLGTLHGLALAAGPAEAVLRWDRLHGADAGFQDFLLAFAGTAGRPGLNLRALAALVLIDRCERERWRCLQRLFGEAGKGGLGEVMGDPEAWSATDAKGIAAVAPVTLTPPDPERWELTGTFPPQRTAKKKNKVIEERAVVVAGRRGVTPTVVEAAVLAWSASRIEVRVPGGLAGGWFGFTSRTRVDAANEARATTRARLAALAKKELRCLPGGIPVDAIGDLPWPPATVPGPGAEPPHLVSATLVGTGVVDAQHPPLVRLTSAPPSTPAWAWVEDGTGITSPRVAMVAGSAEFTLPTALVRDGARLRARLAADPQGPPRDDRDLPPLRLGGFRRLVVVRPRLVDGDAEAPDRRVTSDALHQHLETIAGRAGFALAYQELPEVEDLLAVLPATRVDLGDGVTSLADPDADDPVIERLLAALAVAAVRTAGAEDAWWLAVLPGEAAWARHAAVAGAAGIAVASLAGCAEVLAQPQAAVAPRPRAVLRLIAHSAARRALTVEEAYSETRRTPVAPSDVPAATAPPVAGATMALAASSMRASPVPRRPAPAALRQDDRFAAVQRDAAGRMLQVDRLTALGVDRVVTALLPLRLGTVSVEVVALAGRGTAIEDGIASATQPDLGDASLVARISGDDGRPVITAATITDGHLRIEAGHDGGRPLRYTLEARLAAPRVIGASDPAGVEPTWCRLLGWRERCSTCCRPPWHRFDLWSTDADGVARSLALRVVAEGGWASTALAVDGEAPVPERALRIRRLDDGRLLAEVADGDVPARWRVRPTVAAGLAANAAPRLLSGRVLVPPEDEAEIDLVVATGTGELRERLGSTTGDHECTDCEDDDGQHQD